jgi:hypothetical protein
MTEILIRLTPTTSARMELVALERDGPFRLIVDHPAHRLVEYFTSSTEAMGRWAEIEAVLSDAQPVAADRDPSCHAALPPAA